MPPKRSRNATSASAAAASRRPPRKADVGDDISSQSSGDERQDDKRGSSSIADDPFFVETAAEKKVRVAKEYLQTLDAQLAAGGSDDEGGGGGDAVGEKLKRDAVMLAGKVQHRISQQLQGHKCSVQFRRGHEAAVTSIAASRDNSKIISGGKDGAVYMSAPPPLPPPSLLRTCLPYCFLARISHCDE
jgi:ribosomal RNA-processing protein 9